MIAVLLLLLASACFAHDIPNDITVQAFLKPGGSKVELLVRVPMSSIRDVVFPEREGSGYLDLPRVQPLLGDAAQQWIGDFVELHADGRRLERPTLKAVQVSLESDRSFAAFETAWAHVTGPRLPESTNVYWKQTMLDVLFEYDGGNEPAARLSIHSTWARLGVRVVTVLRLIPGEGVVRVFEFEGDPGRIDLDPRWHQAVWRFVQMGFRHILDGADHLLFLLCLVIPFRRFRGLVPVVTAFTAAHSITLIASAYDFGPDAIWFPALIETLIAVSIVYMALENIVGAGNVQRRWTIAFAFGLVHGFGFSFALREKLQFAGSHLLTSLLSFNVGVELGQLLVLVAFIPVLDFLFRRAFTERMGTIILSAIVAHTGWHWMIDRGTQLGQYRLQFPELTAGLMARGAGWLMALIALTLLVRRLRRP